MRYKTLEQLWKYCAPVQTGETGPVLSNHLKRETGPQPWLLSPLHCRFPNLKLQRGAVDIFLCSHFLRGWGGGVDSLLSTFYCHLLSVKVLSVRILLSALYFHLFTDICPHSIISSLLLAVNCHLIWVNIKFSALCCHLSAVICYISTFYCQLFTVSYLLSSYICPQIIVSSLLLADYCHLISVWILLSAFFYHQSTVTCYISAIYCQPFTVSSLFRFAICPH